MRFVFSPAGLLRDIWRVCVYIYFLLSSLGKFRSDRQGEREKERIIGRVSFTFIPPREFISARRFNYVYNNISRWIGKIFHRVKDPFFFSNNITSNCSSNLLRIKIQRSILPFPSFSVHLSSSLERKGKKEKKEKNSSSRRSSRGGIGTFHPSNGN